MTNQDRALAKYPQRIDANEFTYPGGAVISIQRSAYIAGLEDAGEWMPIDSCPAGYNHPYADYGPHDVAHPSQFVLFANHNHVGVGYALIDEDEEDSIIRYCDEHNEYIDKPTHWQYLPAFTPTTNKH